MGFAIFSIQLAVVLWFVKRRKPASQAHSHADHARRVAWYYRIIDDQALRLQRLELKCPERTKVFASDLLGSDTAGSLIDANIYYARNSGAIVAI